MKEKYLLCIFKNSFDVVLITEQKGPAEEKFNKLKGMYGKLREEHIQLLRTVG